MSDDRLERIRAAVDDADEYARKYPETLRGAVVARINVDDAMWLLDEVDRLRTERDAALAATKVGPDEFLAVTLDDFDYADLVALDDLPDIMRGRVVITEGTVSIHKLRSALEDA